MKLLNLADLDKALETQKPVKRPETASTLSLSKKPRPNPPAISTIKMLGLQLHNYCDPLEGTDS